MKNYLMRIIYLVLILSCPSNYLKHALLLVLRVLVGIKYVCCWYQVQAEHHFFFPSPNNEWPISTNSWKYVNCTIEQLLSNCTSYAYLILEIGNIGFTLFRNREKKKEKHWDATLAACSILKRCKVMPHCVEKC